VTAEAHAFAIEVRGVDGAFLGAREASVLPCLEDTWLRGVQAGELPNDGCPPALRVTPIWGEDRPAVTGLLVEPGSGPPRRYGREVFVAQARAAVAALRREARLDGETAAARWSVVARPGDPGAAPWTLRPRAPFPLVGAELPHVERGASQVSIGAGLLARLRERARTRTVEFAAILLGSLRHDRERRALELGILDEIPLEPGRGGASATHFSFRPASLVAARQEAEQRTDGARPCGWVHSHHLCAACAANPQCRAEWAFFSDDDQDVHRHLFASAHMVGLVAGKLANLPATRPGFRLFGWRDARVVGIDLRVVGPDAAAWCTEDGVFLQEARIGNEAPADGAGGRL
jgi:hypothetical protein